jgi:hypothetical protein
MATYRVERTYQNFVTGEHRTELLPKRYKTWLNAQKCAQRNCWTTRPRGGDRIDDMQARVVEEGR